MKYKILSLCSAGWIGLTPAISFSAPQGGQVTAGDAAISQAGTLTTINQSSDNATIRWDSFNIAEHETVNFIQPGTSSVALNQIGGSDPSIIMGNLNANGRVYLTNPNGVIFSSSSQVNVGSLIATSSSIELGEDNSLQLAGNNGSVINNGSIVSSDSGFIGFFAPEVINNGELSADNGNIVLATQNSGTLFLPATAGVGFQLDSLESINAIAVENTGDINATGGRVVLSSDAIDNTLRLAINNEGIINVSSIESNGGQIRITANRGSVSQTGELNADAGIHGNGGDIILIADQYMNASGSLSSRGGSNSGNGGFIETSGYADIDFDAQVDTTAAHGEWGHWLIDPATVVIDATEAANIESNLNSGNVTVQADVNIDVNSAISGSDTGGSLTLESQQINVNQNISANGINLNASDITLAANISSTGEIDIQSNSNLAVDGSRTLTVISNSALSIRGATVTGSNGSGDSLTLSSETGELSLQSINVQDSLDTLNVIRNNSSASLAEINLSGTISSDNFSFTNQHSSEQLFVLSGDLSINSSGNVSFGNSRLTGDSSNFSLTAGSATLDTIDGIASISINNSGETQLSGNLSTKGSGINISGNGNLTLNDSVTLLTANTGDLIISSDITSSATNNEDLTIQVADGELTLAEVSGINNLSLLNSSDLTTLNGDINIAGSVTTNSTRVINLGSEAVNFTSSGFNSSNTSLRSDSAINIINSGNQVSLGEVDALALSVSSSQLELNGDLTTSSAVTNSLDLSGSGAILIAADAQIEGKLNLGSGASMVAIDNASGNDKYSLDIDVGTQDLTLGEIGANNSLQSFSLNGTGSLTLNSTTPIPLTSGSAGISLDRKSTRLNSSH